LTLFATWLILHCNADLTPFSDSEDLVRTSGLCASAFVEVGGDHRLVEQAPLRAMLEACESH
jgi:hypothetical protein